MDEDASFLRAVFNRPNDDVLRLVYADWLDERDDPRAEYVRLDVERHRTAGGAKNGRSALELRMAKVASALDTRWVGRMLQTRNIAPGARLDLVHVTDGQGRIEVRGGADDTALLVEGKPVALNWDDCRGSVGQYLVFTGYARGAAYARELAAFVEGEPDGDRPLADPIEPLLTLFAPGTYCLVYTPSSVGESVAALGCPDRANVQDLINYYPVEQRNLVDTQPSSSLDADRVAFFRAQIRAGRRPIVLTASADGAWCEFVIDGHHKLAAYAREGVGPTVLGIVRENAPPISLNEGLGWLPPGHPGVSEYRRMKG